MRARAVVLVELLNLLQNIYPFYAASYFFFQKAIDCGRSGLKEARRQEGRINRLPQTIDFKTIDRLQHSTLGAGSLLYSSSSFSSLLRYISRFSFQIPIASIEFPRFPAFIGSDFQVFSSFFFRFGELYWVFFILPSFFVSCRPDRLSRWRFRGFRCFYPVDLELTEFYWVSSITIVVLPSFTGFLPGFIRLEKKWPIQGFLDNAVSLGLVQLILHRVYRVLPSLVKTR